MEAILKNGKFVTGKLAKVFCKIGIANSKEELTEESQEPIDKVSIEVASEVANTVVKKVRKKRTFKKVKK